MEELCRLLPAECVARCSLHVPCMKAAFCEKQGFAHCSEAACDAVPDLCVGECLQYTPCFLCGDSCDFFDDAECDDGGSGAEYGACPPGSDCQDCGGRLVAAPSPSPPSHCAWAPTSCVGCLAHPECLQYLFCSTSEAAVCKGMGSFAGACEAAPAMCTSTCAPFAHCYLCFACDFKGAECAETCPAGSDCADCSEDRGGSFLSWGEPPPRPSHALSLPPPHPPHAPPPHPPHAPPPTHPSHAPPSPFRPPTLPPPDSSSGVVAAVLVSLVLLSTLGFAAHRYRWCRTTAQPLLRERTVMPTEPMPYVPPTDPRPV